MQMRRKKKQTNFEKIEDRIDNLQNAIETQILDLRKSIEEKTEELRQLSGEIDLKSRLGLEDQLFFGVVFSLLILAMTFPSIEDLALFFKNAGLSSDTALYSAQGLKVVLISGLLAASFSRYYGSMKGKKKFGRFTIDFKFASVELLILCLCFFLASVILSAYGSWVIQQHVLLVFTAPIIAIFVLLGIGVLERRWIMVC